LALGFEAFDDVTDDFAVLPEDAAAAGDFAGTAVASDLDGAGLGAEEDEACGLGGIGVRDS
jgi:hypothetical protein